VSIIVRGGCRYLLTGRHGIFPATSISADCRRDDDQYAKFLKSSLEISWRKPISSLNYLLPLKLGDKNTTLFAPGAGFINNL